MLLQVKLCRAAFSVVFAAVFTFLAAACDAQDRGPRVARVLWQDRDKGTLMWGEVHGGQKWLVSASPVKGFPKLDPERQHLSTMEHAAGMLLTGVRDVDDGKFQSGWVSVDTGVREQPHGDHSHWNFVSSPFVKTSRLDADQGNPAHVYAYDGVFYLTNDTKNGFTQLTSQDIATKPGSQCGVFFTGGGSHITLAAVESQVCYATWIDNEGDQAGRVDVVKLGRARGRPEGYSFKLTSGAIHGATTNSGKVFFAPADGICWVDADARLSNSAETVRVNHIPLGREEGAEKPNRTGAFVNQRNWVLFSTGSDAGSALCLLDAKATPPALVKLPIPVADGLKLTTPEVVLASGGKRYAFLFQDRIEGEVQEQLTIVDLDPDGDRSFADARIAKSLPVGASKVDGHHGHHSVAFDSEGRIACFTNPGDGTIWVMSLRDLAVRAKSIVGGTPGSIVALGAPEHKH
jgi:hypothetical protein